MIPRITTKCMDQRPNEFRAWAALCLALDVERYLELGMGGGGACSFMKREVGIPNVMTVDILHQQTDANVFLAYGVHYLYSDSHDPALPAHARRMLGGDPDVVFIDADHSTDGARRDFDLWWPIARKMVAFHDINIPEVSPVWEELCLQHDSIQIVGRDVASAKLWQEECAPNAVLSCGGIGVLFKT